MILVFIIEASILNATNDGIMTPLDCYIDGLVVLF